MKKICAVLLFCIYAVILSGCGNNNQAKALLKESEAELETAAAPEPSSEGAALWEGYIMDFADLDSMNEKFRADWQEQLGETVYSYGGCRSGAQGYMSSPKNSEEELDFPYYFYTLDEFSIPTFYKTTAYGYVADHIAYVMSMTQESFEEIVSAGQGDELAEVLSGIFTYIFCLADYEEEDGDLASIISGLGLSGGHMFDGKVDLSTPETAVADLLHYSGGTAKSIQWNIYGNERIVTYTFADGSELSWYMMTQSYGDMSSNRLDTFWFPIEPCSEETLAEAKRIQKYMTDVSVETLRGLTQRIDYSTNVWMSLPENGEGDLFVLLDEYDNDMAIYGLYGGQCIVLRDGEDIYPVYAEWIHPQMNTPIIRKADYDNDGTDEYALWLVSGTGTGYHQESFFMLEPDSEQETGLRVHEFTYMDMHQFDTIDYAFDEETNVLKVETNAQSVEMDLTKFLESVDEEYKGLGWGDILYIEEKAGQWYVTMHAGIMLADHVQPDYGCGMIFSAPITYMENGCFQIGDISVETV